MFLTTLHRPSAMFPPSVQKCQSHEENETNIYSLNCCRS